MYVQGTFETDEIRENTPRYQLNGKADVVVQNTGEVAVKVGLRTIPVNGSMRLSGELTVLTNESIQIRFENGVGKKQLWVHYITPFTRNGCSN